MIRTGKIDFVSQTKEIAKYVEDLSELKTNLNGLKVEFLSKKELMGELSGNLFIRFLDSYFLFGGYSSKGGKTLCLPKKFYGNDHALNIAVGHEIMHNAQETNFPHIYNKFWELDEHYSRDKNIRKKYYALDKLLEGDAKFIERRLRKFYYPDDTYKSPILISLSSRIFLRGNTNEDYIAGSEILEREFNGNRKEINKLYSKSLDEIVEIFGEKE